MTLPPKVCPACGAEYLHEVSDCAHCDRPLVLDGELPGLQERGELPPISEMVCIRASSVGWAMSLSERLLAEGIPHRVQAAGEEDGYGSERKPGLDLPYGVFVSPHHATAATEIDVAHTSSQIPDVPDDFNDLSLSADMCPACGDPIDDSLSECAGCGLALLMVE